ncbi:hypothetical protein D6833_13635 [Candidatus Parcubacteria bacterium]|nr:MAG: hypothetical protein D6833_13635 [Candidatus Parcubacteria bacterium]
MPRNVHLQKKHYNHREWILVTAAFLLAAVFLVATYVWGIQFMLSTFLAVFHEPPPPGQENTFQFERAEKLRIFAGEAAQEQKSSPQPGEKGKGTGGK